MAKRLPAYSLVRSDLKQIDEIREHARWSTQPKGWWRSAVRSAAKVYDTILWFQYCYCLENDPVVAEEHA